MAIANSTVAANSTMTLDFPEKRQTVN